MLPPTLLPLQPYTWHPWPIRTIYLVCFTTLCVGLCIIIEFIIRDCPATGCPVYGASSPTQLSPQSYILYNFLPTTLSVCFTLLWATSHHDILRLEPYFQMSVQGGALAEDSILLDYPYRFPPLVPFLALKRRYVINSGYLAGVWNNLVSAERGSYANSEDTLWLCFHHAYYCGPTS